MRKPIFIAILLLVFALGVSADDKYFTDTRISVFNGYRNIYANKLINSDQVDFLNYLYTQNEKADYNYFQISMLLRHADRYQIEVGISLYNNLIPYAYNVSFNYLLHKHFGIIGGSMSNRFYLTEFNDFYASIIDKEITTRYITREWKFSMLAFYFGPSYQFRYNTLELRAALKTGVTTFTAFDQRNIIKENLSNYKIVYDYQSFMHFAPFVMPELLLSIDLLAYKKIVFGGRFKFSYLVTHNSINYHLRTYEWTYQNIKQENRKLPSHTFQQTDWDFGIYFRW